MRRASLPPSSQQSRIKTTTKPMTGENAAIQPSHSTGLQALATQLPVGGNLNQAPNAEGKSGCPFFQMAG